MTVDLLMAAHPSEERYALIWKDWGMGIKRIDWGCPRTRAACYAYMWHTAWPRLRVVSVHLGTAYGAMAPEPTPSTMPTWWIADAISVAGRHPVATSRHYAGSFRHIRAQYAPIRKAI